MQRLKSDLQVAIDNANELLRTKAKDQRISAKLQNSAAELRGKVTAVSADSVVNLDSLVSEASTTISSLDKVHSEVG